jgi:hypothetical protein
MNIISNIKNKIRTKIMSIINKMIKKSQAYRDLEYKLSFALTREADLRKINDELAERTSEIGRRICKVSVQYRESGLRGESVRRLRMVMEIDPMIIETGFLHGNDNTVIEYIGRDIGTRAAQEIRRANFQRWVQPDPVTGNDEAAMRQIYELIKAKEVQP